MSNAPIPNVLSIAGSDPSGGAGIQADLKTFAASGCHGMAVIAALTAQNTRDVSRVEAVSTDLVAEQLRLIFDDIDVAAVKIGMLGSAQNAAAVATILSAHPGLKIVLDPVLSATTGKALSDDSVVEAMRRDLFPLATLITPNLAEAAHLAKTAVPRTHAAVETVARELQTAAPTAWLVKGGHLAGPGATADDLLLVDGTMHWLSSPRVETANTHGTGCTLSSAIAAGLAHGKDVPTAVAGAKAYLDAALEGADRLLVGHGAGPLDHFVRWR